MALSDSIERVANTAILAGMSLYMIKLMYGEKAFFKEKARRAKARVKKKTTRKRK
jgi:hypothetical protein